VLKRVAGAGAKPENVGKEFFCCGNGDKKDDSFVCNYFAWDDAKKSKLCDEHNVLFSAKMEKCFLCSYTINQDDYVYQERAPACKCDKKSFMYRTKNKNPSYLYYTCKGEKQDDGRYLKGCNFWQKA